DLLPKLTADDLKDLGIASVGDRRRLLGYSLPGADFSRAIDRIVKHTRRTTAAYSDVLRSRRFDGHGIAFRSRGSARDYRRLSPLPQRPDYFLRWLRREMPRRRRAGLLWLSTSA